MSPVRISVAVVSPLPAVVKGLSSMLARHGDRVEVVDLHSGAGAPDVVLYDSSTLASGDGTDLDLLLATTPATVLAMTYELRPQLAAIALAHGAHGAFDVAVSSDDLLGVVTAPTRAPSERVEPVVPLRLGAEVGLTPREVDVLSMITAGLSNQEIAERSYLSINSVKTYIRSAYRRISVTSRSQAVVWCVQHGFAGAVAA